MPRVYELPTHLEVEDQLIAGLTARQLVRLAIGASLAYGVWDQVAWLPQEVRLSLAGVLMILGIVFALVRPHHRELDSWLLAAIMFVLLPRRSTWRPGAVQELRARHSNAQWADIELAAGWIANSYDESLNQAKGPDASAEGQVPRPGSVR